MTAADQAAIANIKKDFMRAYGIYYKNFNLRSVMGERF